MKIVIQADFDPFEKEFCNEVYHFDELLTTRHREPTPEVREVGEYNGKTFFTRRHVESRFLQEELNSLEKPEVVQLVNSILRIPGVVSIELSEYSFCLESALAFEVEKIRANVVQVVLEAYLLGPKDLKILIINEKKQKTGEFFCHYKKNPKSGLTELELVKKTRKKSGKKRAIVKVKR